MTENNTTESHAITTGGFSPFTSGHNSVSDEMKKGGHSSVNIFTTKSSRRPIAVEKKVKYIQTAVGPDVNVDSTVTPLHAAAQLYASGKRGKLVVYGGSDRTEIADRLRDYNNKESKHGFYNFDSIEFKQVGGERKEGAKGMAGVSGSAARKAKNPTQLKKFLPKALHPHAEDIFKDIHEETDMPLAIFLLGGPGSGKDYVLNNVFSRFDLTEVQADHLLSGAASELIHENKNIVINGANDLDKIKVISALLEDYEIDHVFVSVTNKVSRLRNSLREQPLAESKRIEKFLHAERLTEALDCFIFNNSINLKESSELEKVFFANQIEKLLGRLVGYGLEIKEEAKLQSFVLIREKKFAPVKHHKSGLPLKYTKGLTAKEIAAKKRHIDRNARLSDKDPEAYKDMPGDRRIRKKGIPLSKHTIAVRKMMANEETVQEGKLDVIPKLASLFVNREVKGLPKTIEVARLAAQRQGQIEKNIDKTLKVATVPVGVAGLSSDEAEVNKNKPVESKDKQKKIGEEFIEEGKADKSLAAKAAKSGVSLRTLRAVYRRGVAAWNSGHRPGTTPAQWGHARVNSYINKGKTYHTADKDLREAAAKYGERGTGENKGKFWTGSSWKKPSEMSDEERYGKTGAAIRKLDPEAYKQRDKTAAGNQALLKQLQSKPPAPAPEPREEPAAPAPSGETSGTRRTPTPMTPDEIAQGDAIRRNREMIRAMTDRGHGRGEFPWSKEDHDELDRLTYEYEQELERDEDGQEIEVKKPFSTKREIIKVPPTPSGGGIPKLPRIRHPGIPIPKKPVNAQFELQSDLDSLFEMQLVGTDEYRRHAIAMTPGQNQEIEDVTKTMGMDVSAKEDCDCPDESDCGCDEPMPKGNRRNFRELRSEAKQATQVELPPTADVTPTLKRTKGSNRLVTPSRLINPAIDGLPVASRLTGEGFIATDNIPNAATALKAGKLVGKGIARAIPIAGAALAVSDVAARAKSGDYTGAGISAASGLAYQVPGVGTVAGMALDAANYARDSEKEKEAAAKSKRIKPTSTAKVNEANAPKPPNWEAERQIAKIVKQAETSPKGKATRAFGTVRNWGKSAADTATDLAKDAGKVVKSVPSAASKLGSAISRSSAAQAVGRAAASPIGQGIGRVIPGVAFVSFGKDAIDRFKQGDIAGGAISTGGAIASAVPGVGGLVGTVGAAGANLVRDYYKNKQPIPEEFEVTHEMLNEAVQYHMENNISFTENVFRPGSEMFFEMLKEAKRLYKEGAYEPMDEYEKDLLDSDVGEYAAHEGTMVPLDFPFQEEDLNEEDETGGKGIGKPWRENGGGAVYVRDGASIRKVRFSQSGMKKKYMDPGATRSFVARHHCLTNKDRTSASYWACRWPRFFSNSGKVWW